ncbi:putative copper-transporting P-type ATPase B [Companilactobacillus sp. RD055328]|uniref:copper-translocating P-type ATPase n=1 Tax=Companilactobacillus sp. RD055328 TaxID=2916634 RepID=UPI001FC829D7|nr:copper-translocating P-type ATPase [Companilactobacillus sp. RD055328]GKQ43091.1 putative copper-transporting P-type ATPase B [Companilactobacillus sp. RD055328]
MDHMNMDHDMEHMNHDDMQGMDHSMHHGMDFKKRFIVSLIVTIPIIIMSPMMGLELPFQVSFFGSDLIVLLLATFLLFYGGKPFWTGAVSELKTKNPGMMTLIAMGLSASYIYSVYAFIAITFLNSQHVMNFFWEFSTLIVIMLLGHWIEMKSVMGAGNALDKITQLIPDNAHMLHGDHMMDMPVSGISKDDIIEIRAGETIPLDGIIIKGSTNVNESLVTGESKLIAKDIDDEVIGGSTNDSGTIQVKVAKDSSSGYLSQIQTLVADAQKQKSRKEILADKVAGWLFYAALIVGLIALVYWTINGSLSQGLEIMVTVFVIACPHALGLAVPLVNAQSTSIAAANGLLIRNKTSIEESKNINTVVIDKTGTLTEGKFTVNEVHEYNKNLLGIIGGLEQQSNHPIAQGIVTYLNDQKIDMETVEDVKTLKGYGVKGLYKNTEYLFVNAKYLDENQINYDKTEYETISNKGNSVSYLVANNEAQVMIAIGDQLRDSSFELVKQLAKRDMKLVMLTGDNKNSAKFIADKLGIEYHAELKPEDKQKIIKDYQAKGQAVMMVGDGINDTVALTTADLGVAIGNGTDVAIESADVILVNNDLNSIIEFFDLAKNTNRKMIQNLWWGAGYNIIAIPLAAGLLSGIGIMISPAVGAVIMSFSTIIVAINAMTLKV